MPRIVTSTYSVPDVNAGSLSFSKHVPSGGILVSAEFVRVDQAGTSAGEGKDALLSDLVSSGVITAAERTGLVSILGKVRNGLRTLAGLDP